jgi:hypothetical protein
MIRDDEALELHPYLSVQTERVVGRDDLGYPMFGVKRIEFSLLKGNAAARYQDGTAVYYEDGLHLLQRIGPETILDVLVRDGERAGGALSGFGSAVTTMTAEDAIDYCMATLSALRASVVKADALPH